MPLGTALARNIDAVGTPTKKQKLLANTPLKQFLRPIIEEAMMKQMQIRERAQQPLQRPSGSPLQTALMNEGEIV